MSSVSDEVRRDEVRRGWLIKGGSKPAFGVGRYMNLLIHKSRLSYPWFVHTHADLHLQWDLYIVFFIRLRILCYEYQQLQLYTWNDIDIALDTQCTKVCVHTTKVFF